MKNRVIRNAGKRLLASVLAASMLLGAAGCGKDKDKSESGDGKGSGTEAAVDVKNCTFEQDSDFSVDESVGMVYQVAKAGDNIFLLTETSGAGMEEDGVLMGAENELIATAGSADELIATEGSADELIASEGDAAATARVFKVPVSGGQASEIYVPDGGLMVDKMAESGDNIALLVSDDKKHELKTIDADGNEVSSVNVADLYKNSTDNYIIDLKIMPNGDIIGIADQNLVILGSDGKEKKVVPFDSYIIGLTPTKDGKLVVIGYGESYQTEAKEIDLETGEVKEKYPLNATFMNSSDAVRMGSGDYDFFYMGDDGLYGYKMGDKTEVKLCDYNASLIDSSTFNSCIVLDQEHVILSGVDYYSEKSQIEAYTKVDPSQVKDKKVLKLATLYAGDSLKKSVTEFNKTHSDIRIDIVEYMNEEDPVGKLSADISSGNTPDLYDVSNGIGEMSVVQAVQKGLLEDLTPYMEKDDDISEDDFIESVINASKVDGKLYYLGSSFGINTMLASKNDVGDMEGWTFQDLKKLVDSKPDDVRLFEDNSKSTILEYFLYTCMAEFVNWETGECSFDSQSFKDVLEMANRGVDESTMMDMNMDNYVEDIRSGKQLFLIGVVTPDIWPLYNKLFDDKAVCIGYPNSDKEGIYAQINGSIAVSASCADKDTAWEFVKFVVSREQQGKNYYTGADGMPTRKDIFELYLEAAQAKKEYTDEFGNTIKPKEGGFGMGSVSVDMKPATDAEIQQFRDLTGRITKVWEYDKSLIDIVEEESKAYFAGEKSIDDVTATIQNRAKTYVEESR